MSTIAQRLRLRAAWLFTAMLLSACGQVRVADGSPIVLAADKSNAVAFWHDVGAATVAAKAADGTGQVTFTWDSRITNTTRTYANTEPLADESRMARICGGMHFRYATAAGAELGRWVADWTMDHAFMPQPK